MNIKSTPVFSLNKRPEPVPDQSSLTLWLNLEREDGYYVGCWEGSVSARSALRVLEAEL